MHWIGPAPAACHGSPLLRAERSGVGDGPTYTITVHATDSSGNVTTATCEVSVPRTKPK